MTAATTALHWLIGSVCATGQHAVFGWLEHIEAMRAASVGLQLCLTPAVGADAL